MRSGDDRGLRGRRAECEALDALVDSLRAGRSGTLVLHGEAGIGRSALLGYLVGHAAGCRIARAVGVESETELAFAGLHQLCLPFLDRFERLPLPQAEALSTAFGCRRGDAPDRFLVGLAVLNLLSDAAGEQPLLCVVDDAQWLDRISAQTLAFVARRLVAESVGVVFALRGSGDEPDLTGLPKLAVGGLTEADAQLLLESAISGPLDHGVRDRIVAETRGNPSALLGLARASSPAELAFGFGFPGELPPASRLEQGYVRQLQPLPLQTRLLLLAAAAEPAGDVTLLWRAADQLGIDPHAATPARAAGLLELGGQVLFRHPLVRSAVYRSASVKERQRIHRALGEATDAARDPDRRAWHRGQAAVDLDERLATELEQSAERAQTRGGLAAAAAFQERAAELTPDPVRRAQRALAAAQIQHQAGAPTAALHLLNLARAGPLAEVDLARAELLQAQLTFSANRGLDAPPLLVQAAKRLERWDARLARETYLDAYSAALFAGSPSDGLRNLAEAVILALDPSEVGQPRCPSDLLLEGLALLTTQGYGAATPVLQRALTGFRREPLPDQEALRWLWLACRVARALSDDMAWDELTQQQVRVARRAGARSLLPIALTERAGLELVAGNVTVASSLVAEADGVTEASGSQVRLQGAVWLATWSGDESEARALLDASRRAGNGEGPWQSSNEWASANLYLGLGRYEDAFAAAERAAQPQALELSPACLAPELIEAAARTGRGDRGLQALGPLTEVARASGTDWALGVMARCRALLSDGEDADRLYRESLERLASTRITAALGRSQLLYGEWLRRAGRRTAAREQLGAAHEIFGRIGLAAFADRARHELSATGATARRRSALNLDQLTPQETQIAHLARDGRTNPEIAAQLFLSARTVEWHLRKVFTKCSISSRKELRLALPAGDAEPAAM
ncbi:MAG: AAA family ATPase, partial [Friedmanniella sp.]